MDCDSPAQSNSRAIHLPTPVLHTTDHCEKMGYEEQKHWTPRNIPDVHLIRRRSCSGYDAGRHSGRRPDHESSRGAVGECLHLWHFLKRRGISQYACCQPGLHYLEWILVYRTDAPWSTLAIHRWNRNSFGSVVGHGIANNHSEYLHSNGIRWRVDSACSGGSVFGCTGIHAWRDVSLLI